MSTTVAHSAEIVPAVPLLEQLADADARPRMPGLAGLAALVPAAVETTRERAEQLPPVDPGFAAEFPTLAAIIAETDGRELPQSAEDRAFLAAVDAIEAAFAASGDTEGTWLALRSAVNLQAGRDAITGEK
ncbi:hypothetical protein [Streptomyces kebangsaanensis]|uniref:hypothetical protein n=1 Tax=Streptomyces kebangsaanensis TaxID=864058 RepID=UPI00093EA89F|nr:hypothetical protein [Streptomyces kebangsaanensis]